MEGKGEGENVDGSRFCGGSLWKDLFLILLFVLLCLIALKEDDPKDAIQGFEKVLTLETEKGEWSVISLSHFPT
jgi:hypothetical protein